jgi:hypothetical protein
MPNEPASGSLLRKGEESRSEEGSKINRTAEGWKKGKVGKDRKIKDRKSKSRGPRSYMLLWQINQG